MKKLGVILVCFGLFACAPKTVQPQTNPSGGQTSPQPNPVTSSTSDLKMPGLVAAQQSDVQLDKAKYLPYQQMDITAMTVDLLEPPVVKIVKPEVPHQQAVPDTEAVAFLQIEAGGQDFLPAPENPGKYEVRLFDSQDQELASRAFEVTEGPAVETAKFDDWESKKPPQAKEKVRLAFEIPALESIDAWIALVPSSTPPKVEGPSNILKEFQILGRTRGHIEFEAPAQVGQYELRLYKDKAQSQILTTKMCPIE